MPAEYQTKDGCRQIADTIKRHIDDKQAETERKLEQIYNKLFVGNGTEALMTRVDRLERVRPPERIDPPATWADALKVGIAKNPAAVIAVVVGGFVLLHSNGLLPQVFELIRAIK